VEPRLLQALEQGDHRKLPEGVFIVALARRIAGTLNANVEEGITNVRQSRLMEHRPTGTSKPSGDASPDLAPRLTEPTRKPPRQTPSLSGRPWERQPLGSCWPHPPAAAPPLRRNRSPPRLRNGPCRHRLLSSRPKAPSPVASRAPVRTPCAFRPASPAGWRCATPTAKHSLKGP